MREDNKLEVNELLDEIDQLLTGEDIEGEVTLWDLVLESLHEVVADRIINGNKEYKDEAFTQIKSGAMTTAEKINSIASTLGYFGKSGQSVADWVERTYSVSQISLDSLTDTTEEHARPRKRGERCDVCSNMTKKELKKYDSCPSCGRSLFALKSRGW